LSPKEVNTPLSGVDAFGFLKGKFELYQAHRSQSSHISRDQLALAVIDVSTILSTGRAFLSFRVQLEERKLAMRAATAAT
jgi:hypothetical protein